MVNMHIRALTAQRSLRWFYSFSDEALAADRLKGVTSQNATDSVGTET